MHLASCEGVLSTTLLMHCIDCSGLMRVGLCFIVKSSQVKCIYEAHLKTAHADQSAVQLNHNHNKISKQIEKQKQNPQLSIYIHRKQVYK